MSALSSKSETLVKYDPNNSRRSLNPEKVDTKSYRWNRKKYSRTRRRLDIWTFVLTLSFTLWRNNRKWTYNGGFSEEKLATRRYKQAVWIRESLLELGPTFIKAGQLFSTRADSMIKMKYPG